MKILFVLMFQANASSNTEVNITIEVSTERLK